MGHMSPGTRPKAGIILFTLASAFSLITSVRGMILLAGAGYLRTEFVIISVVIYAVLATIIVGLFRGSERAYKGALGVGVLSVVSLTKGIQIDYLLYCIAAVVLFIDRGQFGKR